MSIAAEPLKLYEDQMGAIRALYDAWRSGKKKVLLVAPTGSGKRYLITYLSQVANDRGKDMLDVTYRRILVNQLTQELARFGIPHGVISGEVTSLEEDRQSFVQVGSLQTLLTRYANNPEQLPPAAVINVDEAHERPSAYKSLFSKYPDAFVALFTATPIGPGGKRLECDVLIEVVKNSELIRSGRLLPTVVYAPSEPNIKGVKLDSGTKSQDELGRRIQSVTAFADLWHEWTPFADQQTIVFAPGIDYCHGLVGVPGVGGDSFYTRGIPAAVIDYRTKRKEREDLFAKFEQRELRVLVCVSVLGVGFDMPICSCGIDLQPNSQFRTYWQKVGRVKRAYGDQTEATWIDMAGNCWKFPHPNEDPPWDEIIGNKTAQSVLESQWKRGEKPKPVVCPKCHRERRGGESCPECGFKCTRQVRRIRMGNGKLREVTTKDKEKHEKTERQKQADWWKAELYAGNERDRTMAQARVQYYRRHREWPPYGLPGMPAYGSPDWNRSVSEVAPRERLREMFST